MTAWIHAFPLSALPAGGVKLYRQGRTQVAVFRLGDDQLFAVDNRCPHEGYPLIQGTVSGCTLTCAFHNYKFDLRDGACIKGDEAVRTYPVRLVDGVVQLDLTPPDPIAQIPGYWRSLEEGLSERRIGQAVRDAARLLDAGEPPAALTARIAAWSGVRAQYGSTHALPVAVDLLQWASQYPGPRFAIPLAQLIELAADSNVRRPPRPAADPVDPGDDPRLAGQRLREAVEAEDAVQAEALLRGALARGWGREEIEPWFFQLCADHFLSFGHRLIYQIKAFDLLEAAGWAYAEPILRGHLFGIVNGTREDVLPAWKGFRKRLAAVDVRDLYARRGTRSGWDAVDAIIAALVSGSPAQAFSVIQSALEAGAPLERVVDAISLAAAERMLRFDVAIDSDPSNQDNWLSVTHTQTFANAVRHAINRFPQPDVLKLIFYAARFVNHHRILDRADGVAPVTGAAQATAEAALSAVRAGAVEAALSQTAGLDDAQRTMLRAGLMTLAISDRFAAPIVSAHVIKNLVVAFEEFAHTEDVRSLMAGVRLAASPVQQRWTHRGALEAVAFITEGRIPKLLAP